jgi:hypothetical protein
LLGYPIIGASLSREWLSQPSGSITLAVSSERLQDALLSLRSGTEFVWLGVGLRIVSSSIVQNPRLASLGLVALNLSLAGKWSGYIKPAQYKSQGDSRLIVTLQEIAARNGAILEFPIYPIVVPRGNFNGSYNWSNDLEGISKSEFKYVYWSDSNAIKLKDFNLSPTKTITDIFNVNVNNPEAYEYHQNLNNLNNITLRQVEDYNTEINSLDKFIYPYEQVFVFDKCEISSNIFFYEDGRVQNEFLQYLEGNIYFKLQPRERRTNKSGSRDIPMFASGSIKDLSVANDITGYTSTYTETITEDENPIEDREELWGFLVNSDNLGDSIASAWGIISQTTTTHSYNKLGYYTGFKKTGFKKERYRTEDPKKPKTLNNTENSNNNRTLYEWQELPVREEHIISLELMSKYYLQDNNEGFVFDKDGNVLSDLSYVPPYFVINEVKFSSSFQLQENPNTANAVFTKGSESIEIKEIKPFSSSNNLYFSNPSSYSTSELEALKEKEGYYINETKFSSEGGQYSTSIKIQDNKFVKGKPSIAAKLPTQYSQSSTIVEEKYKPPILNKFFRAIVVKDIDYNGDNRGNTLSYPQASTLDDVKRSTEYDWFVNNVKNGTSVEFSIQGLYQGYEGECIKVISGNIIFIGIILSIKYDIKISPESFNINNLDSRTQIKIGLLPDNPKDKIQFDFVPTGNSISFGSPTTISPPFSQITFAQSRYSI